MVNISTGRRCPQCGGDLINKSFQAKFCSDECKWKFNNKKQSSNRRVAREAKGKKG